MQPNCSTRTLRNESVYLCDPYASVQKVTQLPCTLLTLLRCSLSKCPASSRGVFHADELLLLLLGNPRNKSDLERSQFGYISQWSIRCTHPWSTKKKGKHLVWYFLGLSLISLNHASATLAPRLCRALKAHWPASGKVWWLNVNRLEVAPFVIHKVLMSRSTSLRNCGQECDLHKNGKSDM